MTGPIDVFLCDLLVSVATDASTMDVAYVTRLVSVVSRRELGMPEYQLYGCSLVTAFGSVMVVLDVLGHGGPVRVADVIEDVEELARLARPFGVEIDLEEVREALETGTAVGALRDAAEEVKRIVARALSQFMPAYQYLVYRAAKRVIKDLLEA